MRISNIVRSSVTLSLLLGEMDKQLFKRYFKITQQISSTRLLYFLVRHILNNWFFSFSISYNICHVIVHFFMNSFHIEANNFASNNGISLSLLLSYFEVNYNYDFWRFFFENRNSTIKNRKNEIYLSLHDCNWPAHDELEMWK